MKDRTRPTISIEKESHTEIEAFQNQTLRPILKLQNDLLVAFFKRQVSEKSIQLTQLEPAKVRQLISNTLQKDINFRSLMLGLVVGHFTEQECQFYFQHKTELNKRTIVMMIERIYTQLIK